MMLEKIMWALECSSYQEFDAVWSKINSDPVTSFSRKFIFMLKDGVCLYGNDNADSWLLYSDAKRQNKAISATDFWISEQYTNPSAAKKMCECGAKHTSFPNHHLDYCPLKDAAS